MGGGKGDALKNIAFMDSTGQVLFPSSWNLSLAM